MLCSGAQDGQEFQAQEGHRVQLLYDGNSKPTQAYVHQREKIQAENRKLHRHS
jgi:hypothetical protein